LGWAELALGPGSEAGGESIPRKRRAALSSAVRIRLLLTLEGRSSTLQELSRLVGMEESVASLNYHLGVLIDAELVWKVEGRDEDLPPLYRAAPDLCLQPENSSRPVAIEEQPSLAENWLEILTDERGEEHLLDILRLARLSFLMVEEESLARARRDSEIQVRPVVAGAVAFLHE
jgi:hypothetical protein